MLGSTVDYCLHLTHGGTGLNLDRIHTIFLGEKFDLAFWSIINNCLWGALSQRLGRERLKASFPSRFCSTSLLVNNSPHSQTNQSCTLSVSTVHYGVVQNLWLCWTSIFTLMLRVKTLVVYEAAHAPAEPSTNSTSWS